MELLEGQSLADRLEKGPLSTDQTLKFGVEIADALDRAHRAGIVHRDLKPGNVMLTKSGVKLLDFGLAKVAAATESLSGLSSLPTQAASAPADGEGHGHGHVPVHGAGAAGRKRSRRALGHFLVRLRALRNGHGNEGVHGRDPGVSRLGDPARRAEADLVRLADVAPARSSV